MDAYTRREAKTRQKEPQMGEQGILLNVWASEKNVTWLSKMIVVCREDQEEEQRGCKGDAGLNECIIAMEKPENKQRGETKQQNKDEQI